jgi:hypothetical protein
MDDEFSSTEMKDIHGDKRRRNHDRRFRYRILVMSFKDGMPGSLAMATVLLDDKHTGTTGMSRFLHARDWEGVL